MSAIDELCCMLDERGIEWHKAADIVFFGRSEYDTCYCANEFECGITLDPLTPEQAIAATVGRETCELVNAGDGKCICFECGYKALDELWSGFKYCPGCGKRVVE